jgi:hypothetical protein
MHRENTKIAQNAKIAKHQNRSRDRQNSKNDMQPERALEEPSPD